MTNKALRMLRSFVFQNCKEFIRNIVYILFSLETIFVLMFNIGKNKKIFFANNMNISVYAILASICLLLLFYKLIKNTKKQKFCLFKNNFIFITLFSIFVLYISLSSLWSNEVTVHSIEQIKLLCGHSLLILLIALFVFNEEARIERFLFLSFLLSLFIALICFTQIYNTSNAVQLWLYLGNNTVSYLGLGSVISFGTIISIYYFSNVTQVVLKYFYMIAFLFMLFVLCFVGSRAALMGVIIPIYSVLILSIYNKSYKDKVTIHLFSYSSLFILLVLFRHTRNFIEKLVGAKMVAIERIVQIFIRSKGGASIIARQEYTTKTLNILHEQKSTTLIIGAGMGEWKNKIGVFCEYIASYPHNIIVEVLFVGGMIGSLLFASFCCYALYYLYKRTDKVIFSSLSGLIFMLFILNGLHVLISGTFVCSYKFYIVLLLMTVKFYNVRCGMNFSKQK